MCFRGRQSICQIIFIMIIVAKGEPFPTRAHPFIGILLVLHAFYLSHPET